jgi:hypothetical protein
VILPEHQPGPEHDVTANDQSHKESTSPQTTSLLQPEPDRRCRALDPAGDKRIGLPLGLVVVQAPRTREDVIAGPQLAHQLVGGALALAYGVSRRHIVSSR